MFGLNPTTFQGPWFATLAMLLAQVTTALAVLTVSVLVPLAAPAFGVPTTWIGGFTSVVYLVAAVTGAMAGDFIRMFGAIRLTQLAIGAAALGLLAFTSANPILGLVAAMLLGLSYGQFNPTSADVLVRCTSPRNRPLIFSIKQTGVVVGGVLAGAIVPLLAMKFGWAGAAWVVAVVVLSMIVLLWPLRRPFDIDDPRRIDVRERRGLVAKVWIPVRSVLRNPKLRWLAMASLGFAGIQVCFAAFLVIYMTEYRSMSLAQAGSYYAMNQFAGVLGRVLWGAIAGRIVSARYILMLVAMMSVIGLLCIASLPVTTSDAVFGVVVFALGLSAFGWNGVMLSELTSRVDPNAVGDATGGVQFVFFGGVVVIPPLFGYVTGAFGYPTAFLCLAAVAVMVAVTLFVTVDDKTHR